MTILLLLAFLLVLGVAAARFGTDSRSSREWARTDPDAEWFSRSGMESRS